MKIKQQVFGATVSLLALVVVGCGGSSGSFSSAERLDSPTSGRVIDGYVSAATVCYDANADWQCGMGEQVTTSDSQGRYAFSQIGNQGRLLAVGGMNNDAQAPNKLILVAPGESAPVGDVRQITPLTTLFSVLVNDSTTADFEDSQNAFNVLFGIPEGESVLTLDPIASANDSNASANARSSALGIQQLAVQVANTVLGVIFLAQDDSAATQRSAYRDVLLTRTVFEPQSFNLASQNTVRRILQQSTNNVPSDQLVSRIASANAAVAQANSTAAIGLAQNAYINGLETNPPATIGSDGGDMAGGDDIAGGDDTTGGDDMAGGDDMTGGDDMAGDNDMAGSDIPVSPDQLCIIPVLGPLLVENVFAMIPGFEDASCATQDDGEASAGPFPATNTPLDELFGLLNSAASGGFSPEQFSPEQLAAIPERIPMP